MNIKYISPKLKESFTEQFMKHLDSFCCYMRVKYDRNCYVRPPVLWLVVWDCAAVAAWRWCRSVTGLCRDIPGSGLVRPDGWCHLTQSSGAGTCVRILHHVDRLGSQSHADGNISLSNIFLSLSTNLVTEPRSSQQSQTKTGWQRRGGPLTGMGGLKLCCVITKTFLG